MLAKQAALLITTAPVGISVVVARVLKTAMHLVLPAPQVMIAKVAIAAVMAIAAPLAVPETVKAALPEHVKI